MAITTTSDLNSLYNTIYERALFVAREMNLMVPMVTNYNATGWMARNISIRPQVSATAKAEGVDFTSPTSFGKSTLATLTPSMVMAQVILTDEDRDTDPDGAQVDAARELGNAVATKIDRDLCADFASFTTDVGPGAGSPATIAKFAVGISVLRNNMAMNPIRIVAHPYHWHDIFVELGQPAANQALLGDVANQALRDFYVGRWINVEWFVSANIVPNSSDDAVSGIFNQEALAFDVRKAPTMETQRDASLLATELNMSAGYAHGVRRNTFGVKYTADAVQPS